MIRAPGQETGKEALVINKFFKLTVAKLLNSEKLRKAVHLQLQDCCLLLVVVGWVMVVVLCFKVRHAHAWVKAGQYY